ncbi:flagellar assembly protein FliH [Erwinia amylovora]|uniref:flagellar assembly protein FliH n=1 Tax=Erwinia amylovora TaxID=552 RepID=UPI0014444188|nr:flagellar assembly protein FliH [Erwinia amylovora]
MPTSDQSTKPQWRSWQPDNLLEAVSPQHEPLPTIVGGASDAQTQAELARLRKQAEQQGYNQGVTQGKEEGRKQGYDAGYQSGHEAGMAQGIAEAQAAQQGRLKSIEGWITSFKLSLDNLDSLIPSRLVQLALQAVQDLHGSEQVTNGSVLLAQIKQLIKQDALLQGEVRLVVHPDDREIIESTLGDTLKAIDWEMQFDAQMSPGGCRILTEDAELDATLETRWQTLCQLAREELSE